MDMIAHILALGVFAYVLFKKKSSIYLKVHYLIILISTMVFMSYYEIFNFFNMQYEIREMFVALAGLLMFIEFIQKEH